MSVNRNKARNWSKNRIRKKIADLQQLIADLEKDIRSTQLKLEAAVEQESRKMWPNGRHIQVMSNSIEELDETIYETGEDVEFLKSLL